MGDRDRLPSVDRLARDDAGTGLPPPVRVEVARTVLDDARRSVGAGDVPGAYLDRLRATRRRLLGPVINATGVLLHTNLGRAPTEGPVAGGYVNLEYDLDEGRRGPRHRGLFDLVAQACGAE